MNIRNIFQNKKPIISIAAVMMVFTSTNSSYAQTVSGSINGHDYVDLGLSVKWATCNVGADSPEEYGDYYAWGETSTKGTYTEDNSMTYGNNMGDISGNSLYDAARANWGSTWRLPTKMEFKELMSNCTWTWTTQGSVNGYKVTGPNDNTIFLPAAGSSFLPDFGDGCYWSSTPEEYISYLAYSLDFCSDYRYMTYIYHRYAGFTIRPVTK